MGCRILLIALSIGLLSIISTNAKPRADINCAADIAGCCCRGNRGNVDCDFNDLVDIVDLTLLIDHLYLTLEPLPSNDEANIDGEGTIDISDLTRLIDYLFISQTSLPGCPRIINHAPKTRIGGMDSTIQPFINTVIPNVLNPGVVRHWSAEDKLDHPYEPQPFSYQWRLYGPYDSATTATILSQFKKVVFVTIEDEILPTGQGMYIPYCDTTWSITPPYVRVTCDTMFVDTVFYANKFGTLDTILDVQSADFLSNLTYNQIVTQSGNGSDSTTDSTSTVLYDFFGNAPNDRTTLGYFILWVRAIDHDFPPKADPAPPFEKIAVVDGKHEKEILIVDGQISYEINPRRLDSAKRYWTDALARWKPGTTLSYHMISQANGNVLPLTMLLEHKVVIAVSDDVISGVFGSSMIRMRLMNASAGGTNVWVTGRALLNGYEGGLPNYYPRIEPWLGITKYIFSGWDWYWLIKDPSVRIEDFIGADPVDAVGWPVLQIDSAYLHSRYKWDIEYYPPWIDTLAALPEVVPFVVTPEAELLYTYNSLYTGYHPLIISQDYFFDSKPVVYRIDRENYRLFVSSFTPYSLAGDSVGGSAQTLVDSALNWLYEPFEGLTPAQRRGVKP